MATDDAGTTVPEETDLESVSKRAEGLTQAVLGLRQELGLSAALEERTTQTEGRINETRRWVRLTIFGLILDITLTFFGGALFFKVKDNSDNIKRVQCSLYSLVLSGGYRPGSHLADLGSTPAESLKNYNAAYAEIIRENNTLGCVNTSAPIYITDPAKVPVKSSS